MGRQPAAGVPGRDVTRLVHATRTLEPGPSAAIIGADAMRHRLACSLPDDAEVDIRLVYLAPSLRNALNGASYWRPGEIIPWYAVTVTRTVITRAAGPGNRSPPGSA